MSLALDIGLFFRNSKTKLGLSLAARGILFTLAFRVGTRSSTWVSPESLADECGIHRQNIFAPLSKIVATGLVIKKSSMTHKQKKTYSFTELIKNYHQKLDDEKRKVHQALNDEFNPPVDKRKNQSGKPDSRLKNQSGKPDSYQSGKPDSRLNEKNVRDPDSIDKNEVAKFPKEKAYSNILKQNRATSGSLKLKKYPENFYPDEERRQRLSDAAQRTNNTDSELLIKFETVSKKYKTKSVDWQTTFEEFLKKELPKKVYEDKNGQRKRYDNQPMY